MKNKKSVLALCITSVAIERSQIGTVQAVVYIGARRPTEGQTTN